MLVSTLRPACWSQAWKKNISAKERNREDISDHLIQWPMMNDSCMQSRMGMGVTENMEVVDGTYKELMSVNVIRHVLNLTSSR